jgi:hypothetical protein
VSRAEELPLKQIAKVSGATVKVVVSVATMATVLMAAPGAGLVVGAFTIPYSVLQGINVAGDIVDVARELHTIFFDSPASREAQRVKKDERSPQKGSDQLDLGGPG